VPISTNAEPEKPPVPRVNTTAILTKAMILFLVAVAVYVLYKTTPLQEWLDKTGPVKQWIVHLGEWGVVVFILSSIMFILLGVPRLLLCPLMGALYGFWWGLLISLASTMASYYIGFLWIRGRARHGIDRAALPRQLAFLAGDPGFVGVIVGRLIPLPGMVVTTALAVSNVKKRHYLLGSLIGLIPEGVPAVLAGAFDGNLKKWGTLAAIALLCIALAWLALHLSVKRSKN